ncbi:MAG: tetratricopeptide repeat protein [Gammaproteobacteria bacterium]
MGSDDSCKKADKEIRKVKNAGVEQLLTDISVHLQNNRLAEARALCLQILQQQSEHPHALQALGIVEYRSGNLEEAADLLHRAIAAKPDMAEASLNLANIHAELGRFDEAVAGYRRTIQIGPGFVEAYYNLGKLYQSHHHLDQAHGCYQQALVIKPEFGDARRRLAEILNLLAQATALAQATTDQGHCPSNAASPLQNVQDLCEGAAAWEQRGQCNEAMACYKRAIEIKPDFAKAHGNLGNLLMNQGRYNDALICYQTVLAIDPGSYVAYNNMGNALRLQNRIPEAEDSYRRALELNGNYGEVLVNLGTIKMEQGRIDEALNYFHRALEINPRHVRAAVGEIRVYEIQGEFEKAYSRLLPFLQSDSENMDVALSFSALSCHIQRSGEAIEILERLLESKAPAPGVYERILLHFEAGRLLDNAGEYDRAFAHYRQGNELKIGQSKKFDPEQHAANVKKIIKAFSADFMHRAPRATETSELPIFVVGMPRSGTSLVEQILASHPRVFGAGELPDIMQIADSLPAALGVQTPFPQCVAAITEEACNLLGQRYLHRLRSLCGDAERVTDKMPANYFPQGLIALLFPEARVIHCSRNPLDTCLSCYFQNFVEGNSYSNDLGHLGSYYRQYQRLMEHWAATLDIPMMEVRYEELVADHEAVSRAMIEFCGLDWDERVLRFHTTDRVVATASYDQVRRPLYKKSVERWKNYERGLSPLIDALTRG